MGGVFLGYCSPPGIAFYDIALICNLCWLPTIIQFISPLVSDRISITLSLLRGCWATWVLDTAIRGCTDWLFPSALLYLSQACSWQGLRAALRYVLQGWKVHRALFVPCMGSLSDNVLLLYILNSATLHGGFSPGSSFIVSMQQYGPRSRYFFLLSNRVRTDVQIEWESYNFRRLF